MSGIDTLGAAVRSALAELPFPWLLVYLVALAIVWLFVEAQVTWLGRKLWHGPAPLLPGISGFFVWVIRIARWGLVLWLVAFVLLAGARWMDASLGQPLLEQSLGRLATAYHGLYAGLVDALPEALRRLPGI